MQKSSFGEEGRSDPVPTGEDRVLAGVARRWGRRLAATLAGAALVATTAACDSPQGSPATGGPRASRTTVLTYEGPDSIGPQKIVTPDGTPGSTKVTCWRVGDVIQRFQGPTSVNWNSGGGEGIRGDDLASANSSVSLKWKQWYVSAFRPKGLTTTATSITFAGTELKGGDAYQTNNRSTSVVLNGTLTCTDFVEGPGERAVMPTNKAGSGSDTASAAGALPGARATAYYHALGRRDWKKACSYWDPKSSIIDTCPSVAEGLTAMGDKMGGKKSSYAADYRKVKVRESDVKVSGDKATFSYTFAGGRYDDVPLVRRNGVWYIDVSPLEKLMSGGG